MNIKADESIGFRPRSRQYLGMRGEDAAAARAQFLGQAVSRAKGCFPEDAYHFGKSLVGYEEEAHQVTAWFADGIRATGDLLIGGDGLRSVVRAQFLPQAQPRYAGYVGWRGMVKESALPAELHRRIFDHQIMSVPDGRSVTAYLVPGPDNDVRPGHRAFNFVWYHAVDEAKLRELCTDAQGRHHEHGIPPPLIRPEFVAEARKLARQSLPPQFAQVIELTPQVFFQPIYDVESTCLGRGRVAVLGDAAFVARPHLAMGVTKAGLDAESLADALDCAGDDLRAGTLRSGAGRVWPPGRGQGAIWVRTWRASTSRGNCASGPSGAAIPGSSCWKAERACATSPSCTRSCKPGAAGANRKRPSRTCRHRIASRRKESLYG